MMTTFGPLAVQDNPSFPIQLKSYRRAEFGGKQAHISDDSLPLGVMEQMRFRRLSDCLPPLPKRRPVVAKTQLSHDFTSNASTASTSTPLPFLKELFISPHPDDICYSCFGTAIEGEGQSKASINGRLIVTVFSKSRCANGHLGDKLKRNVEDISSVRKEEDERFATSVGCKLLQLGLSDSSARDEFSRKEELALQSKQAQAEATRSHPTFVKVHQALNDVIRWAVKCKASVYMPLGIGCHIDHLMTRVAAESIMEEIRSESPTLHMPVRVTYYEDLPYAFNQTEETIERMASTVVVGNAKTRLVALDEQQWARKLEAVEGYETQMKPTIVPSLHTRARALAANECHTEQQGVQLRERVWILEPGEWMAGV